MSKLSSFSDREWRNFGTAYTSSPEIIFRVLGYRSEAVSEQRLVNDLIPGINDHHRRRRMRRRRSLDNKTTPIARPRCAWVDEQLKLLLILRHCALWAAQPVRGILIFIIVASHRSILQSSNCAARARYLDKRFAVYDVGIRHPGTPTRTCLPRMASVSDRQALVADAGSARVGRFAPIVDLNLIDATVFGNWATMQREKGT